MRRASHANSWYSGSASQLDRELSSWLSVVTPLPSPARAVICPHAGYSYSGPTAAYRSVVMVHEETETDMLRAIQFPTDRPQHCEDHLHPGP